MAPLEQICNLAKHCFYASITNFGCSELVWFYLYTPFFKAFLGDVVGVTSLNGQEHTITKLGMSKVNQKSSKVQLKTQDGHVKMVL
jgi:hypothetical protein